MVLLLSFALGMAGLGRFSAEAVLVLAAVVSGFVGRHALVAGLKLRPHDSRRASLFVSSGVCASVAGLSAGVVLLSSERPLLVPLFGLLLASAAASTLVEWKGRDRTAWGEMLNMLGLSLLTPLAACAATGRLVPGVFGLWSVSAAFSCGGVFHVRYLVRGRAEGAGLAERLRAGAASILFHTGALAVTFALSLVALVPAWTWVVIVPNTVKAVGAVVRPRSVRPPVRRIGLVELAHSLLLLTLTLLVFRIW